MLWRCLNESLDLQRGIIDRCTQNLHMPTSHQFPPQVRPFASSTPHVQMPAIQIQGPQSFQAETHTRTENIVGMAQSSLELNNVTRTLASVLHQSRLEPLVFMSDGKVHPDDWVLLVDAYRTSLGLSDAQILLELPRFLAKEPRKRFTVLNSHVTSWTQFCTLFKTVFIPSDNQERVWRGILDRVQAPGEPFLTFITNLLSEFKKLKSPPPEQEQIDLIHIDLVTLCTATRASRSATGAVINGTGPDGCLPELDMFHLLQVMCLWYMCFCAEVFFFLFSDCTPNGA